MAKRQPLSIEARRKRSVAMHRIVDKLLSMKKQKQLVYASPSTLRKRAQNLAKAILRKKVAGVQGAHYAQLSTSQKIAVDRLLMRIPASVTSKLAKKLLPVVQKHEKERVRQARKAHDAKYEPVIGEAREHSAKAALRQRVATMRSAHRRHKRSARVIDATMRGAGKSATNLLASRLAIQAIMRRLGKGGGHKTKYGELARKQMRAVLAKGNITSKNVRQLVRDLGQKTHRFVRQHKGMSGHAASARNYGGARLQTADYELDGFADMITEQTMEKFEQLFIRGLVPKDKVEIYKRIFDDLESNIKYRRFHNEITDLIETMIKLITNDQNIYHRIRQKVQQKKI